MRAAGLRAGDGRVMLVAQGAAAFRCWFPGLSPPVDLMRGVVDAALR
jgi:shikimate 5-dehydrogenase